MGEFPRSPGQPPAVRDPPPGRLSAVYLVIAALLIGWGLFSISLWMETFSWWYFTGVLFLAFGGLMLFSPRAGPNAAG